jgi:hypothetical protein
LGVAQTIGGEAGHALARAAQVAYVDGMSISLRVGAVVVLIASAIVARYLPAEHDS